MSSIFGIMDNRDALCPGCKTLPTVHQLMGHYHRIHDCSRDFLSCDCPFCVWLNQVRVESVLGNLADVVQRVTVDLAVFPDDGGNQNLHLDLIYEETGQYFTETRFEMIANPCMCLKELWYSLL
jgi:hypothetical protein